MRSIGLRGMALFLAGSVGCSSQLVVTRPSTEEQRDRVNGRLAGRDATLTVRTDAGAIEERETEHALLVERSLFYTPEGARERVEVPLAALQRVHILDRARGGREGLGFGALAGLAVGAVPVGIAFSHHDSCGCGGGGLSLFFAGGTVLVGSLLGMIVGGVIGHRVDVAIEAPPAAMPEAR